MYPTFTYAQYIISAALTVSVDILDSTILEGHSTFLTVSYTGFLHSQSVITVIITATPGSASGWF